MSDNNDTAARADILRWPRGSGSFERSSFECLWSYDPKTTAARTGAPTARPTTAPTADARLHPLRGR